MANMFRVGRISSINYATGMARVTYEDRDNATTDELPLLLFGFIYWMPRVGDPVLVLHMDNGLESGVILGRYYCDENVPPEPNKDFFRMEFERGGNCFLRHAENQVIELYAPKGVKIYAPEKGVEIIATDGGVQIDATAGGVQIKGDTKIEGNLTITKTTTSMQQITGLGGLTVSGGTSGASATVQGNIKQVNGSFTSTGDVVAGSISLQGHTHTCPDGETSSAH